MSSIPVDGAGAGVYARRMDMDIAALMPRKGRRAKPVPGRIVRELVPADFKLLAEERGIKPQPLQKLRSRHHALARALASGMKDWEAALACGYDVSRVSILKADPTFQELVQIYTEDVDAQYADMHERLAGLSTTAAEILQDRLEDDPDSVTVGQLHGTIKIGADRTGHGPQSRQDYTHVHIDLSNRLQAARKRVEESRTLELTANEPTAAGSGRGE